MTRTTARLIACISGLLLVFLIIYVNVAVILDYRGDVQNDKIVTEMRDRQDADRAKCLEVEKLISEYEATYGPVPDAIIPPSCR